MIGGKRSLQTMTPEERSARAKKASDAPAKKRTENVWRRKLKPNQRRKEKGLKGLLPAIPQGYVQCEVCGEFNGTTDARNLSRCPRNAQVGMTCLCHGIPCPRCKTRLIHRPISNTYYRESNSMEHVPSFSGMIPCTACRAH